MKFVEHVPVLRNELSLLVDNESDHGFKHGRVQATRVIRTAPASPTSDTAMAISRADLVGMLDRMDWTPFPLGELSPSVGNAILGLTQINVAAMIMQR